MKPFNRKREKPLRQHLRRQMPPAEVFLWSRLRNKQLGVKFRRQFSVGPYVLDFYCPSLSLAIEVDGDSHFTPEAKEHDARRDLYLCEQQIVTIRFTNLELRDTPDAVVETIHQVVLRLDASRRSNDPL